VAALQPNRRHSNTTAVPQSTKLLESAITAALVVVVLSDA
jgi:hypothetical protein